VQLPSRVRDLIAEFFACLLERDGRRCGEIVLESAVNPERADAERFIEGMIALVDRHGGGNAGFDMRVFGDAVFKLQQAHRIYAASDFAFPLISLNVLDGTVRGFSESVEFRQVGVRSGLSLLAFLLQQLHDLRDASLAGLRLLRAFDPPDVLTLVEA
jgi:ubiquinone biosynthesis protein